MGERKVLNKYIPPDFDPAKMPKGKRAEQGRMEMRMMLPMSIQCEKCGNFMYRGTKFNSKKEDVLGETYMGMKIFRFIMKCTQCNGFFSIKTDPKNADYVVEYGVSRNFEPWREQRAEVAQQKEDNEAEKNSDAMRSLEHRTEESRRQMEMLDELEELRAMKASHGAAGGLSAEEILALNNAAAEEAAAAAAAADEEDAEAARAAFAAARRASSRAPTAGGNAANAAASTGAAAASSTASAASAPLIAPAVGMKRPRPEEVPNGLTDDVDGRAAGGAAGAGNAAGGAGASGAAAVASRPAPFVPPFGRPSAAAGPSAPPVRPQLGVGLPIAVKPKGADGQGAGQGHASAGANTAASARPSAAPASAPAQPLGLGGLVGYGSSDDDEEE